LLYRVLKIWVGLAMKIFCRRIIVNDPSKFKLNGPLLLATNHPNSFLDAVILDVLFEQPIYSLARGDVFKKPLYIKLLTALKILPVYRTSEGVENLNSNYETFEACKNIFRNEGVVLIFSEGQCINEWRLRSLKKGTARLAISSWDSGIDLRVLPAGINYSSFRRFGKNIFLNFGTIISRQEINNDEADGKKHMAFNNKLQQELEKLVYEIPEDDKVLLKKKLAQPPGIFTKILLAIPAATGFLLNAPLYLPVHFYTINKTSENDHYDSVMIALLVFLYPLYLLLISFFVFAITKNWLSFSLILLIPFTAWSYVQLKKQTD
jgi:1-acyl-sn-glycerol-3-phosphate acyltransferase